MTAAEQWGSILLLRKLLTGIMCICTEYHQPFCKAIVLLSLIFVNGLKGFFSVMIKLCKNLCGSFLFVLAGIQLIIIALQL